MGQAGLGKGLEAGCRAGRPSTPGGLRVYSRTNQSDMMVGCRLKPFTPRVEEVRRSPKFTRIGAFVMEMSQGQTRRGLRAGMPVPGAPASINGTVIFMAMPRGFVTISWGDGVENARGD